MQAILYIIGCTFLQHIDGMQIALRCVDVRVAKRLLYLLQSGALQEGKRRIGMTQPVGRQLLGDAAVLAAAANNSLNLANRQRENPLLRIKRKIAEDLPSGSGTFTSRVLPPLVWRIDSQIEDSMMSVWKFPQVSRVSSETRKPSSSKESPIK